MSPEQIALVQSTWRKVQPVGDTAAELFYGKLFSLDPSVRALFKNDMKDQGRNLTAMISAALLWMLESCLGEAFTPEVRSAWVAAYDMLAKTMQEAACAPA